ncbi:tyrosine-protein kinase transmembrane modulator EpsC [Halalkalibacter wakoensis JCM 9140]|uniref:Tyrosine-protein kinase transmembrane modulator EpsC n=1 Tax=Halalkalibacter wakoensis JCM 9140 TaxID=1236970 RepID=W4Q702_9BACI|nr:Wzz/FepE/Etk N-terminal domain-containing protein [Halalkalibacter wakoensis]GAE27448.1 tyrosine-protein kinase transmembrane modulator EpsC [Halalkalibacter wakoensis JCM 9140]
MEETISLKEIFSTLKKRIVMIMVISLAAVGISGLISYFSLTPIYQSSTQILVSQQAAGASSALQAVGFDVDSKYIQTYNVIMKSPYILDEVIGELGLERSHGQLNSQINVSQEGQSQVVTIRVEDPDPSLAVDIANTTAAVFQREISNLLRIDNVVVLAPAELHPNPTPVSPNPELNMAIAFVVGLMASVGLAFLLEFLDQTIRTEQDIEQHLGLPVIGAIAQMDEGDTVKSIRSKRVGSDSNDKTKSAS